MDGTHGHESRLMLPIENGKPKGLEVMCDAVGAEPSRLLNVFRYCGSDSQRCTEASTGAGNDSFQDRRRTFGLSEMQKQRYEGVTFDYQFRCAFPGMAFRQD
jgi:hypothetical protein